MKVIAITVNGLGKRVETEVNKITVGCKSHPVTENSVRMLINEGNWLGRIAVYVAGPLEGKISGEREGDTLLYSNGQDNVKELIVDGEVKWKR